MNWCPRVTYSSIYKFLYNFHLLIIIYELLKDRFSDSNRYNSFFLTGKPPHLSGRHESMNILLLQVFFLPLPILIHEKWNFLSFLISDAYFLQTVKKNKMIPFFLTIIIKELIIVFDNTNKV